MIGKNLMSKRIMVISPAATHPQTFGTRQRIYTLLLNLREFGNDIYFVHIRRTEGDEVAMRQCWGEKFYSLPYQIPKATIRKHQFSRNRLVKLVQAIANKLLSFFVSNPHYTYSIDDLYDESINNALLDLSKSINPNIVFVEYVFFSKALECFGNDVLKIIDTHNVFADKYKKALKINQKPSSLNFSTTKKQENIGLNRADIIVAIQKHEADIFKKRLPNKKIITVGHTVSLYEFNPRNITNKILFIGSNINNNYYSINFFIKDIFPLIKSKFQTTELIIAGSICDRVANFDGCLKLGIVENLKDVYDMTDVVINPIFCGTGLKIKNIEALGFSKPLITTDNGAEGMENGAGRAFLVAESPDDFVKYITRIFSDPTFYENLSRNAYSFAYEWNQNCLNALKEVLEDT
jgi:glycosyltransferase involved in cell wall biosynthesis